MQPRSSTQRSLVRTATMRNVLAVLGVSVALTADAFAQTGATSRPLLAGVRSLSVSVSLADCEKAKLDSTQLFTASQLAFRRMGVEVVDVASYPRFNLLIMCQVMTETPNGEPDFFAIFAAASLEEGVRPLRAPSEFYFATTWQQFARVWDHPSGLEPRLERTVGSILARFENEWLAANPRRP